MSLVIHVDRVAEVLLADGWHKVMVDRENLPWSSFHLEAYTYYDKELREAGTDPVIVGDGMPGMAATGFSFQETSGDSRVWVSGPLSAILAVRHFLPK